MSAKTCTSYAPGHNIHFIQVKLASKHLLEVKNVELVDIEDRWFNVLVDGEPRRGWHHSASAIHQFFEAAEINRGLANGWYYPEAGLTAGLGPQTLRDLHHNDGDQGQILQHDPSGKALSVNLGENGRAFLSVCWEERPEKCHVHIKRRANGWVSVG